jgi:hypothetical protein
MQMTAALNFEFLFHPVEHLDSWIIGPLEGAPLLVALALAFVLGLRHASDPDHLVAVTSLVAADGGGPREAARLGTWWGLGHAGTLVMLGIPLIAFKGEVPVALETGAEKAVGLVMIVLAARILVKWARGDYRAGRHPHVDQAMRRHRHLRRSEDPGHGHHSVRTPGQALGIGALHGLAGTGAVVVLLLTALPTQLEAALALAVFAPMSIASMAACTTAFSWVLTRRVIDPVYRGVLIPALGAFGLMFGLWYAGL